MNKTEITHAVSTFRRAAKDLETVAGYSHFMLNDSIPYENAKELIQKKLALSMANLLAASEYLWIQTGVSLPKELSDEFLGVKLSQYAESLGEEISREEEGIRLFNEALKEFDE